MIDLESERPFFHWCTDSREMNSGDGEIAVERSVWYHVPVVSFVIAESSVTFDAPADWVDGISPLRLQRTSACKYESYSKDLSLKCVRAETRSHVIMTGRWFKGPANTTGVFIAVFPVNLADEIELEDTTMMPERTFVSVAIANS